MKTYSSKLNIGPSIIRIDESEIPYILFTSDLHIEHKNILHFTKRLDMPGITDIDSMKQVFLNNINTDILSRIPSEELHKVKLFNCGDLILSAQSKCNTVYEDIKKLLLPITCYNVIGNHDINNLMRVNDFGYDQNDKWFWNNMYLIEVYRNNQCIAVFSISHQPLMTYNGSINIHGHLHTVEDLEQYKGIEKDLAITLRKDGHYIDVGVDRWLGHPVWLSDILNNKTDVDINKVPQLISMKWNFK